MRDAADLYTSLKYPPVVFICDSPCGFVRPLNVQTRGIVMYYGAKILDVLKDLSMQRNLHRYVEDIILKH